MRGQEDAEALRRLAYLIILAISVTFIVLSLVYQHQIINALIPFGHKIRQWVYQNPALCNHS